MGRAKSAGAAGELRESYARLRNAAATRDPMAWETVGDEPNHCPPLASTRGTANGLSEQGRARANERARIRPISRKRKEIKKSKPNLCCLQDQPCVRHARRPVLQLEAYLRPRTDICLHHCITALLHCCTTASIPVYSCTMQDVRAGPASPSFVRRPRPDGRNIGREPSSTHGPEAFSKLENMGPL